MSGAFSPLSALASSQRWQFRIAITLFTRHGPPLSSKFVLDDFRERITE